MDSLSPAQYVQYLFELSSNIGLNELAVWLVGAVVAPLVMWITNLKWVQIALALILCGLIGSGIEYLLVYNITPTGVVALTKWLLSGTGLVAWGIHGSNVHETLTKNALIKSKKKKGKK